MPNNAADAVYANLEGIYAQSTWATGYQANFEAKITEIQIHPAGYGLVKDGTILKIGCDEAMTDIRTYMRNIADGLIVKKLKSNILPLDT